MWWLPFLGFLIHPLEAPAPGMRCSIETFRHNPEGHFYPLADIRRFVHDAEVIVRAIAVAPDSVTLPRRLPSSPALAPQPAVRFRIVELLHGSIPDDQVLLLGRLVERDDFNTGRVPYRIVRSAGKRGDCYASEYRMGAEYLLLLRSAFGLPLRASGPLAPVNEQIRGATDPWLEWVRAELRTQPPPPPPPEFQRR